MSMYRSAFAGIAMLALPFAAAAAPATSFVPFTSAMHVQGPAAESAIVHFEVGLRLGNAAGLQQAVAAHRVLTPVQLAAYLPSAATQRAVVDWLRGQGLTVEGTPVLAVRASGTAAAVARALGVGFVKVNFEGRSYVSADREPSIPATLAKAVIGINGLEPQLRASPMLVKARDLKAVPLTATGGVPPLYPIDILTAYDALGLGTGAGTTTAIVIDVFPTLSDLTEFWSTTGVNQSLNNITLIQTNPGTMTASQVETSIDTEQSSSMAPGSKVRVYGSVDLAFADIDKSYQQIIADLQSGVKITQVSGSFGACETGVAASEKTLDDQYFQMMTSLGASVFFASGDFGAYECGDGFKIEGKVPSFPSTSPNVTAVGGTTMELNSSSMITSQTGWSLFAGGGAESSGGGISKFYGTPSFQQSLGYAMRAVPDVASDADPNTGILVVYGGGQEAQYGGTSIATPAWAGLMGLVNAQRIVRGKPTLGLVAARTTSLVDTSNLSDITSGNNGYPAGIGYDLVTGAGTPVMRNLIVTLVKQP